MLIAEQIKNQEIKWKNVVWQIVHLGVGGVLMLVLWVMLGRYWTVELFGYFNYFFAFIAMVGIFIDFGMDVLLIKLLSKIKGGNEKIKFIPKPFWKLKKQIFILVIFFSATLGYFLNFPSSSLVFFLMGISLPSFTSYFNAIFRARDELHIEAKISLLQKTIFTGLSVAGVVYYQQEIYLVSVAYFISHLMAFVLTLIVLNRKKWLKIQETLSKKNDSSYKFDYWKNSWPLFITALLAVFAMRLDLFLLQWLTNAQQVGYFSAAIRLFEGTSIFSTAIIAVVFPMFVKKSENNNLLYKFYKQIQKLLSVTALSLIIPGFIIIPTALVFLYGEKFSPSVIILQSLLPLILIVFLTSVAGHLLIAIGKQSQYMKILAMILVFQIAVNLITINLWGIMGAVLGYWIREIVLFLILSFYIRNIFRVKSS